MNHSERAARAIDLIAEGFDLLRIPYRRELAGVGAYSIRIPMPEGEDDHDPDFVDISVHHERGIGPVASLSFCYHDFPHDAWREMRIAVEPPKKEGSK